MDKLVLNPGLYRLDGHFRGDTKMVRNSSEYKRYWDKETG